MDYIVKMRMARADIANAIAKLKDVDGLEYIVEQLQVAKDDLCMEMEEYTSHTTNS